MDKDNKLFSKMEIAATAMSLCCDDDGESPVAKSEVYNETWMLRLALAFIHDHIDESKDANALSRIAKAVKRRWISEGGLTPVFNMEGTTWTDSILGNIKLGKEKLVKDEKTKRGVTIDEDGECVGVVVIEAKMNSDLASGITHASDYNQVARNIACLASLVMDHEEIAKQSAFFVFAPESKINTWTNREDYLDCKKVWKIINGQLAVRSQVDHGKTKLLPARNYLKETFDEKQFRMAVNHIAKNSFIISWEDMIQSVAQSVTCVDGEADREALKYFYLKTCEEYKLKPEWRKLQNL